MGREGLRKVKGKRMRKWRGKSRGRGRGEGGGQGGNKEMSSTLADQ